MAFAALLASAPSACDADEYSLEPERPLRLRALLDTRIVHGGRALAWTDRGPGKTRYGGNPNGDGPSRDTRLVLSHLALEVGGSLPFAARHRVHAGDEPPPGDGVRRPVGWRVAI